METKLESLSRRIGCDLFKMQAVATTASRQYKCWHEKKKSGGTRLIEAPFDDLKAIQRKILKNVLHAIPVHGASYGRPGTSHLEVAALHLKQPVVLKMDLQDFYPSVTLRMVRDALLREGFVEEEVDLLARLTTRMRRLPQGAPTSPCLARIVLRPVLAQVEGVLSSISLICRFGAFVDDLSISGPNGVQRVIPTIKQIFRRHGFHFNPTKTLVMRKGGDAKEVLGLRVGKRLTLGSDLAERLRRAASSDTKPSTRAGLQAYRRSVERKNRS